MVSYSSSVVRNENVDVGAPTARVDMRTVSIKLGTIGSDPAEIDRLTHQFRQELLGVDVEMVTVPSAGTASGAKGDPVAIGTLVVTLANSAVLASICQLARTWVTRDRGRRIVVKNGDRTLEVDGSSAGQQQQVIDAFLADAAANTDQR